MKLACKRFTKMELCFEIGSIKPKISYILIRLKTHYLATINMSLQYQFYFSYDIPLYSISSGNEYNLNCEKRRNFANGRNIGGVILAEH